MWPFWNLTALIARHGNDLSPVYRPWRTLLPLGSARAASTALQHFWGPLSKGWSSAARLVLLLTMDTAIN